MKQGCRFTKVLGTLLLSVLLLSACSEGPLARSLGTDSAASPAPGESPGSGSGGEGKSSKGDPATPGGPNAEPQASGAPGELPPRRHCEPEKDCMSAYVHSEIDWGCKDLSPNEVCKVPFIGHWFLFTSPTGSVAFLAFENESPEPAYVQEVAIPPLPRKGNMGTSTRFLYKANPGTHTVTFQAVLKDGSGKIVAQGLPSSFPVKPQ